MSRPDHTKLNDHGTRMFHVIYRIVYEKDGPPNIAKMIGESNGYYGNTQFGGTAEQWNVAEGFIHSWWEKGSNITPFGPDYNFADIVSEKMNARYDESWDFKVYDKEGRGLNLKLTVTATPERGPTFAEVLEQDRKDKEREKADEAKKAEAKEQAKAERERLKAAALDKLSPAERRALGL